MSNIIPKKTWNFDLDRTDTELPDRSAFFFPSINGETKIYLCGHSLGLQPRNASIYLNEVLDQWKNLAVDGHFAGDRPWINYLEELHQQMARLVNAEKDEVVIMNSLTVNIHILLSGFYKPEGKRCKILLDFPAFPSDIYAIRSHLEVRGFSDEDMLFWEPNPDTGFFENADLEDLLIKYQDEIDLIFISGVHYLNGQYLDIENIAKLSRKFSIKLGLDLAHAVGNVELFLHDWEIDFACWCTYKYLNGGPGSLGAAFIHRKHHDHHQHFLGWWGNSIDNRFEMKPDFTPSIGASSWQLSNPPLISLPPLRASLDIYSVYGMSKIRAKSKLISSFLYQELLSIKESYFTLITPEDVDRRGAMICLRFAQDGRAVFQYLSEHNVVVDYRQPDTIRVAANPLYNNFQDVYRFVKVLEEVLHQ